MEQAPAAADAARWSPCLNRINNRSCAIFLVPSPLSSKKSLLHSPLPWIAAGTGLFSVVRWRWIPPGGKCQQFLGSAGSVDVTGLGRPGCLEAGAVIKRLLRPHSGGGEPGIQVGAAQRV